MVKLERIYVQNYKNIAEADLELGNMNVIVGENGSGKTNLLSVIPFLNFIINGDINHVKEGFSRGLSMPIFGEIMNIKTFKDPMLIRIEFTGTESNLFYSYEIQTKLFLTQEDPSANHNFMKFNTYSKVVFESFSYKSKTKTGKANTIFKRTGNEISYGEGIRKGDAIISNIDEHSSVMRLLNLIKSSDNIANVYKDSIYALDSIFYSNIYYLSPQVLKRNVKDLSNSTRILGFDIDWVIASMNYLLDYLDYKKALKEILGITNIESSPLLITDPLMGYYTVINQNGKSKNLHELSDGSIVLLALITKIFSDSSDIFFIEEPENSIHPRALYELMKLIREKSLDKQFIITTHSPYLLNMIKPEEVLVAEIQDDGLSKISKLPNVKAIKKKLAKSFMSFGDIVFAAPDTDDDSE
jgi:predicted ATPase